MLSVSVRLLATTRVDLDRDWLFRTDPKQIGETSHWQNRAPRDAVSVNLPHTWNVGRQDGYLGRAWYCKTFAMPLQSPDLHVKLHFGATFYRARIWLNGVEVGTHEGAKRAKNLGLSLELTLLFDGGSSASVPPAWANHTLSQLQTDIYNCVKAEIMAYRQAGTMPDLVAIGNEVDTGFLGSIGSPTGADFGGFRSLEIEAMQAIKDAAADTSSGPAIPPPLTCIHITPAWDLTEFFTLVNQNSIPYDAICQSYYPLFHGPLTDAQANPNHQPVEQDVLVAAATNIGKPIFIIETGEHYENGFDTDDLWYGPPSPTLQAQFLLDLQRVQKALPHNLGMGFEYWNAAGVNLPRLGGGWFNGGTDLPDAIYVWNGLTIFNNSDTSGSTDVNDPNYSEPLPALDTLGGH
jgi:arabinogalactan endo-1,4-beta-galactosidase